MVKVQFGLVSVLLAFFLTGCFIDSRIIAIADAQKDSSSSPSEISVEVKTLPASITYLESGAVTLVIAGAQSADISDFQVLATDSCQMITNGCGDTIAASSNCSIQLRFDGDKLNSVQCNVNFSYRSKGQTIEKAVVVQSPVNVPGVT